MARAPYGYRYVKRSEHADAFFEVDEAEAPIVRDIFRRYLEEDESIAKIGRWLTAQGVPTTTRATGWNNGTIWGMLRNPAYARQAAYGKTRATGEVVRATRQARLRGQRSTHISREEVAPEDWKRIMVPVLISEERFALAQERLHRNSRFSPRNTCRPSLLQGILVCRECGYAYYRCSTRSKNGKLREYYRCSGTDGHRRPEGRVCENRPVRLAEIDELVWDVLTRTVIGQCLPRHTHIEFLRFLMKIDRAVPNRSRVHLILDNYGTHNHPKVRAWLARHRRFHLHFTPTSSSWLNMVEIFFSRLTEKAIHRGIFHSVPDLITAIETYLAAHNADPKPFTWTATTSPSECDRRR
jgi:site-specific DNA recombinase